MRVRIVVLLLALVAAAGAALAAQKSEPVPLAIEAEPLGDASDGVVTRISFRYQFPSEVAQGIALFVQGSILQEGAVVKNFRLPIRPGELGGMNLVQTLPVGEVVIEARLLGERDDGAPLVLAKTTATFSIASTGSAFEAEETASADAIVAEGVEPESTGAVRIQPPRRDVAPNLFIVEVAVTPPVVRVEFWVEGKKIFTKNAPPYRAEVDLGLIPRRVEVRVVGYDRAGRYVDADAWVVNERETPLEVKITRTVTPDGVNHLRLSVQNPKNVALAQVVLFADDRKLASWMRPPYAIDVPAASLEGTSYLRASAQGSDGYEASDLLYLDGNRYTEKVEVNLVELPVSVLDERGQPVSDLAREEFKVVEDGKSQSISDFAFANDLPLSIGVLVDHSGSMEARIDDARKAAIAFFEQILRPGDRAFFGGFSWAPTALTPLIDDLPTLRAQVAAMAAPQGGTALYDAIVTGLYRFRSVPGRKAFVVVTDGEDTVSRVPWDEMLSYVRVSRVPIFFIGVGLSRLDFSVAGKLKTLAAETGGVAYFANKVDELGETYEQIERDLRSQYLVSYYTESMSSDRDYRTVEVTVTRPGLKVRTIRGYIP